MILFYWKQIATMMGFRITFVLILVVQWKWFNLPMSAEIHRMEASVILVTCFLCERSRSQIETWGPLTQIRSQKLSDENENCARGDGKIFGSHLTSLQQCVEECEADFECQFVNYEINTAFPCVHFPNCTLTPSVDQAQPYIPKKGIFHKSQVPPQLLLEAEKLF